MWRFRRRYNGLVLFLVLVIIISVTTVFLVKDEAAYGSSTSYDEIQNDVEDDKLALEHNLEKKSFSTSKAALTYAYNYLNNSKGYTSSTTGRIRGKLGSWEFINDVGVNKEYDLQNNKRFVNVYTRKCENMIVGASKSSQYIISEDMIYSRVGSLSNDEFVYPNEYETSYMNDYLSYWKLDPSDLFIKINLSDVSSSDRPVKNGGSYELNFSIPAEETTKNLVEYCLKMFNGPNTGILQPIANYLNVKVVINAYGVIKSIAITCDYSCDLTPVGFPFTITGSFELKEVFTKINTDIVLSDFTK